jgi:hypothetical protein
MVKRNSRYIDIGAGDYRILGGPITGSPVQAEANARLIAAAPEMAELLVKARYAGVYTFKYEVAPAIDALLSRIRGEAEVSA